VIDREMKNKNLKKIYNDIYKKGEKDHYTKLLFEDGEIPLEERQVLHSGKWKGKTVLDVGCGTGLLCYEIAKSGARRVVGIDFSNEAVRVAKNKYQHKSLEFIVDDLKAHKGQYDTIVSLGTLEHMDDPLTALRQMKKLLKPGGTILLTTPNWTNPRGYVLQTIRQIFDIKITLADLHYLTPIEFEKWAKKIDMPLKWETFDLDWAHGEKFISDIRRRLPLVFKSAKIPVKKKNIDNLVNWLEEHVVPMDHALPFSGALALYTLKKKK